MRPELPSIDRPRRLLRELAGGWTGAATLACVAYVLPYLVHLALTAGAAGERGRLAEFALLPPGLLAVLLVGRAATDPRLDPQTRRGWRIFGASLLLYWVSDVAWSLLGQPDVSVADVGYLLAYPGYLWGLLSFPAGIRSPEQRAQLRLDLATVMLGGTMVAWYFVLGPTALSADLGDPLGTFVALAYPIGDLVMLFGAVTLVLRGSHETTRRSRVVLAGAVLCLFVGDVTYSHQSLQGEYRSGGLSDAVWAVCYLALVVSVWLQLRAAGDADEGAGAATTERPAFSRLPYAAVAVGYGLLLSVSREVWSRPAGGVILGAVALTALVVARQVRAMRENARLQAEAAARRSEARFRSLVHRSSDVVMILDAQAVILFVSPSVERVFGYAAEGVVGQRLTDHLHPDDAPRALAHLAQAAAATGDLPSILWRLRHSDGSWRHVDTAGTNLGDDPTVGGIVLNSRDVTDRIALEAQLTHQAFHDPLTGLANRALFRDRVQHALARETRQSAGIAVLFLDLDDFKTVNDSLGHARGDQLLGSVAARLVNATRGCDTVARLGGDEFAVLLENIREDGDATAVAERIIAGLRDPFSLEAKELTVGTSIGIARAREGDGVEELLRNADVAMYGAKQQGKGGYELFAPEMHAAVIDRLEMEADLRHAVERQAADRNQFRLVFQPIVSLESGAVHCVETLVRWDHPGRGVVSPGVFIPVAEETGLIIPLGRWVLEEACRVAAQWGADSAPGEPPSISVNISGRQLQRAELVDEVAEALRATGLAPSRLVLEITESVIMHDHGAVLERLQALKLLGVRLAVDDFGTGYSSLGYLHQFPIDVLKIDKSFVDDVAAGGQAAALLRTIIALGDMLTLRTVAEGVETAEQYLQLRELGCGLGQGYLFARPQPPEAIRALLRSSLTPAGAELSAAAD